MSLVRKIVLVGPMGSGKTSLGKRLATYLQWRFYDTDHAVMEKTGTDIATIFAQEGEAGFRKREHQIFKNILQEPCDAVVACGGGIILASENRRLIMAQALVIFLDVSVDKQLQRISNDRNRPLVCVEDPKLQLEKLRDERLGLYTGIADIYIDTDEGNFTFSFKQLLRSVRKFIGCHEREYCDHSPDSSTH